MSSTATAYEVGHLYEVAPGELKIGTNVRTDTHPDAKEFAASITARGVLEVITAHVDDEGSLRVVRGQRRTLVAAKVGTPTGTVPVRVVPSPDEVDRIIDQVSENVHREGMHVCARPATPSSSWPCSASPPRRSPSAPPSPGRWSTARWRSPPTRRRRSGWTPTA